MDFNRYFEEEYDCLNGYFSDEMEDIIDDCTNGPGDDKDDFDWLKLSSAKLTPFFHLAKERNYRLYHFASKAALCNVWHLILYDYICMQNDILIVCYISVKIYQIAHKVPICQQFSVRLHTRLHILVSDCTIVAVKSD